MPRSSNLEDANRTDDLPGNGVDEQAALRLALAIAQAFKSVEDHVRPHIAKLGLTITEFSVLRTLYYEGPIPLGELSQHILLTGASTTYTVKKLEDRGLLLRRPKPEDHRVILGTITDKGRRLIRRILPLHAKDVAHAMTALSRQEKKLAITLLERM